MNRPERSLAPVIQSCNSKLAFIERRASKPSRAIKRSRVPSRITRVARFVSHRGWDENGERRERDPGSQGEAGGTSPSSGYKINTKEWEKVGEESLENSGEKPYRPAYFTGSVN